ncbi:MAG: hypothetical protein ACXAEU_07185 [Candidatus Hodarchaeales archaeon]
MTLKTLQENSINQSNQPKPNELTPSTACRYPKRSKSITIRLSAFTGLLLLLLFTVLIFGSTNDHTRNLPSESQQYVNSHVLQDDDAHALVQTADGGFIVAGYTSLSGIDEGDSWLMKIDANGVVIWNKTYGGKGYNVATALVQTADGGFALAGYTYLFDKCNSWLVKIDANGEQFWNQTYGGTNWDEVSGLIQTLDGGFALTGSSGLFGDSQEDMWLVKTDENGNTIWVQTYRRKESNVSIASALVQTADGGYVLAGYTNSINYTNKDMWLVKTDANGNMIWNQTYGGPDMDIACALIQTDDGDLVLAGTTASFGNSVSSSHWCDMWLVKTDVYGKTLWNQTYGGIGNEQALTLVQTLDGGFALAGFTLGSFDTDGCEMYLVKTDANGMMIWNKTFGGERDDWVHVIIQTDDGCFTLAGGKGWQTGGIPDESIGDGDTWLVKTDAKGVMMWNKTYDPILITNTIATTTPGLETISFLVTGIVLITWHKRRK